MSFPESDWKRLRGVKEVALERFCERVLGECQEVLQDDRVSAHERYVPLFRLTRDRDQDLAGAFDDHRRSTALLRLIAMRKLGVVSDEEMEGFSTKTRESVENAMTIL